MINLENKYKININNINNNINRYPIEKRFESFFIKSDGIFPPHYLARNIDLNHNIFNTIIISGLSGEFLRNFYYTYDDYIKYKNNPKDYIDKFCDKYTNNNNIIIINDLKINLKKYLIDLLNNYNDDFNFMEILYINHMKSFFNYNDNTITPYYNIGIISNILKFDKKKKCNNEYYKEYIGKLIPIWDDIKFIKNKPIKNQYLLDNKEKKYLIYLINNSIILKKIFNEEYLNNVGNNMLYKLSYLAYIEKHIDFMYNNS